jgi:hypothetical protein
MLSQSLRPQALRDIALDAIKPFYDNTLEERTEAANRLWQTDAQRQLTTHRAYQIAIAEIGKALTALEEATETFHGAVAAFHGVQDSTQVA